MNLLELPTSYQPELVVLSIIIAMLSSFVAISTVARIHDPHITRLRANIWSIAFGVSLGAGIWSMHFMAILALNLPILVHYDLSLTLMSLFVAIVFATLGALPMRNGGELVGNRLLAVGTLVGLGIASMHYIGMAAMRMNAHMNYDIPVLLLSIIIAIFASSAALRVANQLKETSVFSELSHKATAAVFMGVGVSAMHYVGMAAVHFYGIPNGKILTEGLDIHVIVIILTIVTAISQGIVLLLAAWDEAVITEHQSKTRLRLNEAMNDLLTALNQAMPLDNRMSLALDSILNHTWLGLQPKGAIFSMQGKQLTMLSSRNMGELVTTCANVALGQCLCGRVALSEEEITVDHIDERHELGGDQMENHGHCILPLKHGNDVLGVLNVYLPAGSSLEKSNRIFLESAAGALAQTLAREQSKQESLRLEVAIDQVADAIFIIDEDGDMVYANHACEDFYGINRESNLNTHAHKLSKVCSIAFLQSIAADLDAGRSWAGEVSLDVTSEVRTVRRIVSPVANSTYLVCMDHDVTEERIQQRRMEHIQRLDSLGVLAGGIAHDFNNILTVILGNAAMAERKAIIHMPTMAKYLKNVVESSEKAADLCRQMLAYSGKGKFVVKAINLSQMIEEITKLLEVSISKNVILKYHLAEQLPCVEADVAQMQQVMMNLVINASHAIGSKSGIITIGTGVMQADASYLSDTANLESLPEGRYVYLEISDTGCGMDQQTQKHIFEPFFTTKTSGHGLGMSAVLGIVRGHHGTLKVYSELGHGTTFKLLLPISNQVSDAPEINLDAELSQQGEGTILIVDDEETIRETAAMMLEDMGFKTLAAADGQAGVEVFKNNQHKIVAVLLDMTMPKLDGQGCFSQLQRIQKGLKVILSSGYNEQEATSRFTGKGLAGFIQKPYTPDALHDVIHRVLNSD